MAKRRGEVSDEKPDPVRRKAAKMADVVEEPSEAALAKPVAGEAATGAPPAGRTTLEDARAQGPFGFLQVLGPGLITGASDDDPSGIGTYSQAGSQFGLATLRSTTSSRTSAAASVPELAQTHFVVRYLTDAKLR